MQRRPIQPFRPAGLYSILMHEGEFCQHPWLKPVSRIAAPLFSAIASPIYPEGTMYSMSASVRSPPWWAGAPDLDRGTGLRLRRSLCSSNHQLRRRMILAARGADIADDDHR